MPRYPCACLTKRVEFYPKQLQKRREGFKRGQHFRYVAGGYRGRIANDKHLPIFGWGRGERWALAAHIGRGFSFAFLLPLASNKNACYIASMNSTQHKTLAAIFTKPANGNIAWSRIEALLVAVGCRVIKGNGSSVTFEKNGMRVYFHRPHPQKEALRYRVEEARDFLIELGVKP